jgi:hypothetical protein
MSDLIINIHTQSESRLVFKQLPPFPCRFSFCITPLFQEVQAPGLNFIWKKQFSMFFSLSRLFISFCLLFFSFHFLHISLFRFAFVGFVNSIQAGFACRQTFRSSNVIFYLCLCVCQYLWIIKFLEWAYRKKWGIWVGKQTRHGLSCG